jgi:ABC-2 type transport system ATP-binding protein
LNGSILSIQNLSKRFPGEKENALNSLSVDLPKEKIIGIIGPDGAGKTTLIRLIMGLLTPTEGTVDFEGLDVFSETAAAHKLMSYMPQQFGLYEDLTVRQNMELYASLRGVGKDERESIFDRLLKFSHLDSFQKRLAKKLSGGMRQKLSLISALLQKPKLLVLDEPTVGVDPVARRELWSMLQSLCSEGISILWSTCYLDEAEKCDSVLLLNDGDLFFYGEPDALTEKLHDRTFLIKSIETGKRELHWRCISNPSILDSVVQGADLRVVLKEGEKLPSASDLGAGGSVEFVGTAPRFEDAFIDKLGGGPEGISPVADAMPPFPEDREVLIKAEGLTKKFGRFTAAKDVSFAVERGEIFGLLGPNGAGKSTTFRMLCGLMSPTSGTALIKGTSIQEFPGKSRLILGYVAQKFSLYGKMTVKQNLNFFSGIYSVEKKQRKEIIENMIEIFSLESHLNSRSGELPLGFKQRLALACSIMHRPEILFLDEATSGVDPVTRREFWNHIHSLVGKGTTVMITTHYMDEAEYCDRIGFLSDGELVALGTPDELKRRVRSDDLDEPTIEDAFVILCGGGGNG